MVVVCLLVLVCWFENIMAGVMANPANAQIVVNLYNTVAGLIDGGETK